jgi:hypothetical protein
MFNALRHHRYSKPMPTPSERFQRLTLQFDTLIDLLNECPSSNERKQLLRLMWIVIEKIEETTLSTTNQDRQDTTSSSPPDPTAAES